MILNSFSYDYWPFVVSSLEKCLFKSFNHFKIGFLLLLGCKSSLCILNTSYLLDIWFANVFSHSFSCLFIFLKVSFEAEKFLILMESSFIFSLVAYGLFFFLFCFVFCCCFFFYLFRAALAAYRDSHARGRIRAVAAALHHSHSNTWSKLCLWPAP